MFGIPNIMNLSVLPFDLARVFLVLLCAGMCSCSEPEDGGATADDESAETDVLVEPPPPPPIEEILEGQWRVVLFNARQEIFDGMHPVGSATDVRLHSLEIKWRNNVRTNREKDILGMAVRYTVFWDGPITKNGFTKLFSVYDAEVGRIIATDLLATNGVTTGDVAEGVGMAIGLGLSAAMQSE